MALLGKSFMALTYKAILVKTCLLCLHASSLPSVPTEVGCVELLPWQPCVWFQGRALSIFLWLVILLFLSYFSMTWYFLFVVSYWCIPVSERIKYKTACMCYNAITGSASSYPSELLHLYSPSHSLRSSSDTRMLKIQHFNHKTHGFCTFSHFASHIWNNLSQDIRRVLLSLPSKASSRHFSS